MRHRLRIDRLTGPAGVLVTGDGRLVAGRCYEARSALARLVGLLATPALADDEAVWLVRCRSIHTLGMRRPVRCAALDRAGRVIALERVAPRRVRAWPAAAAVIEAGEDGLTGLRIGDRLALRAPPAGGQASITSTGSPGFTSSASSSSSRSGSSTQP